MLFIYLKHSPNLVSIRKLLQKLLCPQTDRPTHWNWTMFVFSFIYDYNNFSFFYTYHLSDEKHFVKFLLRSLSEILILIRIFLSILILKLYFMYWRHPPNLVWIRKLFKSYYVHGQTDRQILIRIRILLWILTLELHITRIYWRRLPNLVRIHKLIQKLWCPQTDRRTGGTWKMLSFVYLLSE